MRFVKLVALGLGAALVSLTAMSNAGPNQNLTGLKGEAGSIIQDEYMSFKLEGTGECMIETKTLRPDGSVDIDDWDGTFPTKLPSTVSSRQTQPGIHTVTVTTVASAKTPNCPGGQSVSAKFEVIKTPRCPDGWDTKYLNKTTGAISCVPYDPTWDVECKGKTQAFFDSSLGVCQAGCQSVAF